MRRATIIPAGVVVIAAILYAGPKVCEFALLRIGVSRPVCLLIGDAFGCAVLFAIGFRKSAAAVYVAATALEFALLYSRLASMQTVMFVLDAAPTLLACGIFLFSLIASQMLEQDPI